MALAHAPAQDGVVVSTFGFEDFLSHPRWRLERHEVFEAKRGFEEVERHAHAHDDQEQEKEREQDERERNSSGSGSGDVVNAGGDEIKSELAELAELGVPFPDVSWDLVVCSYALHLLDEKQKLPTFATVM